MEKKRIEEIAEIRKILIDVVSKNGGHLAANLGVVELTYAMHSVFDLEKDVILWDVGHQSYVHKILSDRKDKMGTIRQLKGLSPFTNVKESKYDHFISGHAGNSLSAAYGIAEVEKESKVIAVIGDASFTNGQIQEALNIMGEKAKNVIVVLNDNEMSIGKNVGAMSRYLSRIMSKKFYYNLKGDVESSLRKVIFGNSMADVIKRMEHSVRNFVSSVTVFEDLGFKYIGPVDGHDLKELENIFGEVKEMEGPFIIHVKTKKGKGYKKAEDNPEKFHGVGPFDIDSGETAKKSKTYSASFGEKLIEMAQKDERVIAISAGMVNGTGLKQFFDKYPERSYDVGIAEEHAVTFAGGLAIKGKRPYVAIYSTFMQRAFDQVIHDIAIQNLSVTFIVDRAGIVGEDGETHQGLFDVGFLSLIPGVTIMSPACDYELNKCMELSLKLNAPCVIRIPRSEAFELKSEVEFITGRWREIKKGKDHLIIASGSMLKEVLEIEKDLENIDIFATIVSPLFMKPLDDEYILKNVSNYKYVHVLEENLKKGGLGMAMLEFMNEKKIEKSINIVAIDDKFIEHGKRDELMKINGLKGKELLAKIVEGGK